MLTARLVFERTKSSVRSALCKNDAKIFDSITYYFPEDTQIDRVRAGIDDHGNKAVEISEGFVDFNILIMQAMVYSTGNSSNMSESKQWPSYLSEISNIVTNQPTQVRPGVFSATIPRYDSWAKIPEKDYVSYLHKHEDIVRRLALESFMFALAHEVGHHVLGHSANKHPNNATSRNNEWAADLYALSVLSRLGLSADGSVPNFVFYSKVDGPIDRISGTHDPAVCRAMYLLTPGKSSDGPFESYRRAAIQACGRQAKQVEDAIDSKDRSICYRP